MTEAHFSKNSAGGLPPISVRVGSLAGLSCGQMKSSNCARKRNTRAARTATQSSSCRTADVSFEATWARCTRQSIASSVSASKLASSRVASRSTALRAKRGQKQQQAALTKPRKPEARETRRRTLELATGGGGTESWA